MQELLQVAVVGIIAALMATMLKKHSAETALLLSLAACLLIALMLVNMTKPVLSFLSELRELTGLDSALMTPMLKAVGIGLLTQISATVCTDAGQSAIAKLIELCGGIFALYVALPLFEAVIQMMKTMGGGG